MPPRRAGLGRGLDALIAPPAERAPATGDSGASGSGRAEGEAGSIQVTRATHDPDGPAQVAPLEVEIGRIEPNPLQPRRQFDAELLADLAESIREHGIIQPLVVTAAPARTGDPPGRARYMLIAGERRWQASRLAGLVRVPVVVREAAGRELLELALVENVQRADLNPLEEAAAFQQLSEEFGLTQEEIGRRVGKSRFAISNTMRLLQLPARVQQAVLDGRLSEGHARAVLGLAGDREAQERLAQEVIDNGWTVRQVEEAVRRLQQAPEPESGGQRVPSRRRDAATEEIEERFREALGTRVALSRSRRGGRLVIHYYDDEQLQSIYDRLANAE
ncbi:MAG: Chromosome (plasmid) partitioning protein ParB [uncultured Chloroflexi bacterium]|uniref:Chromosome (Plasmid) partitioning protein ParB n=1 Tax=uncultured Chloroflexota bacterium TaxID=166587 RepID=A0A6J4H0L7_9CHLR|nr:MAG: Chromosome (plasmid) partitioning protein ParB [uncultured Chloroflexota bacterium]